MTKRKHRVVVELTASSKATAKEAVQEIREALGFAGHTRVLASGATSPASWQISYFGVKSFDRVTGKRKSKFKTKPAGKLCP